VRSASGDDGRELFQCGAQRARIQGPRCYEPVRPISVLFSQNGRLSSTRAYGDRKKGKFYKMIFRILLRKENTKYSELKASKYLSN
jgi:hypothetical protein